MKRAVAEAEVLAPVDDVYGFVRDFESYVDYSEYVKDVRVVEAGERPVYDMDLSMWSVDYTVRSGVVDVVPGELIEWRVIEDFDVSGTWEFEPLDERRTAVRLEVLYDLSPAGSRPFGLVSTERLIRLLRPVIGRHARKVLRRVTEEVEGEPRDIDYVLEKGEVVEEGATPRRLADGS